MNRSVDFLGLTELIGCCSNLYKDMTWEEWEKRLKLQMYKQKPNQSWNVMTIMKQVSEITMGNC